MKLVTKIAVTAAVLAVAGASPAGAAVIDSINGGAAADDSEAWGVQDVGWFYTPTFSYTLDGIGTKFGSGHPPGRLGPSTATAEIFSGAPGSLTLLGSGTLTPQADVFADATLADVALTAGTTYFVAFQGVENLGVDLTSDAGATSLPPGLFLDFNGDNTFDIGPVTGENAQPIIEFLGSLPAAAVPEPGTLALVVTGLAGLALIRRRRGA